MPIPTAEEWLESLPRETDRNTIRGSSPIITIEAIESRDRAVRRKALVDAAKARCSLCVDCGLPSFDELTDVWRHNGMYCSSSRIHDLAKLDAEVKHGG